MKIKNVRYGRVVPARDGTKFSTERCEVELEAEFVVDPKHPEGGRFETFEELLLRAQALVSIGVGEIDIEQLRKDKAEIDQRLATLARAGVGCRRR